MTKLPSHMSDYGTCRYLLSYYTVPYHIRYLIKFNDVNMVAFSIITHTIKLSTNPSVSFLDDMTRRQRRCTSLFYPRNTFYSRRGPHDDRLCYCDPFTHWHSTYPTWHLLRRHHLHHCWRLHHHHRRRLYIHGLCSWSIHHCW